MAIAFLLSFLLASSVAKPVIELENLMSRAETGDFSTRFEGDETDDIGRLGRSYNAMISEIRNLIGLVYKEQHDKREAELHVLQEQIKPHFLYNTLETIRYMARKRGAADVEDMVVALTRLFRIGLSRGAETIALSDEIEHAGSYLFIQSTRYAGKFDYAIDVQDGILGRRVLRLIIQPLVENAIYHGIKEKRDRGFIRIAAKESGDTLVLSVEDDGAGMNEERQAALRARLSGERPSPGPTEGFGVYNVNERLRLSFGPAFGIRFQSAEGRGTKSRSFILSYRRSDVMPWKILIADDEPLIRESLGDLVPALLPDSAIVAVAEDGEEALALTLSARPDILLVDIRMPFLSGLDFVERLASLELDCVVIVVTGHDEFEYARKALTLGVFDYILKPVENQAMASTLLRAAEELTRRRARAEVARRARAELERNKPCSGSCFSGRWSKGAPTPPRRSTD